MDRASHACASAQAPPAVPGAVSGTRGLRHPALPALAGLLSLAVGIGIGRFAYTPILPYMSAGLDLAKSEAGLIASANFLGYLLGALAAAWRAVPGSSLLWLLGALAVSGLSTGAMPLTTSLGAFLLLRFVQGVAGALVMVLASSLVMDRLSAAGRDGWAAVMYAGVGSGIAISALAVPAAASDGSDWQGRGSSAVHSALRSRFRSGCCCDGRKQRRRRQRGPRPAGGRTAFFA